ncbi:hypothetical protein DFAR_2610007 [Desulfarculales bacterium]
MAHFLGIRTLIDQTTNRGTELVQGLLSLGCWGDPQTRLVDLSLETDSVANLLSSTLSSRIAFEKCLTPGLRPVFGDSVQF